MFGARISRGYLRRHPWLVAFSVVGVALGVAVVVAIDLANSSAATAFRLSSEAVAGRATHVVRGPAGTLPDSVYASIRLNAHNVKLAPVVEDFVRIHECENRVFRLLGVDPIVDGEVRTFTDGAVRDPTALMTEISVLLTAETAAACSVSTGDTIKVSSGGLDHEVVVAGLVIPADDRSTDILATMVVADVSTSQEILGLEGFLTRVDVVIDAESGWSAADLRQMLPDGYTLDRSETRTETLSQMTRAFDVNLRALSLLALVVGMFLIYNSVTFSVVQRRSLIGRLRALGMTRREIFVMVMAESFVIGLVGTVAGLAAGVVLATGLLQLVTQSINDLYYAVSVRSLEISSWNVAKGIAIGVGATLAASTRPAWEATTTPVTVTLQRSTLETITHRVASRLALASIVFGLCAGGVLAFGPKSITVSYAGLFMVILAAVSVAPVLVLAGSKVVRPLMGYAFGLVGRMAANGVGASLSRTGIAIAALMVAVASTIGVGVMVTSFRTTVEHWLGYSLQADIYVQPPNIVVRRGDATIVPAAVQAIRTSAGVRETYTVARTELRTQVGDVDAVVIEPGPMTPRTFRLREGSNDVWEQIAMSDAVLVSEPFGYRHGFRKGDRLRVVTKDGATDFEVAGVYYDFGSDLGAVIFSRAVFRRHFPEPGVNGMALYTSPEASVEHAIEGIQNATGGIQDLFIQSNRTLRARSLEVFDRTFLVTSVLRLLAVVVAFVGIMSALMALQMERSRELAILRANGMTPGQVWWYVTMQTGLMGLFAGALSVPLGLGLAWLLVFVINKRSFGWTLQFDPSAGALIGAIALSVAAALLAGLYPAWRMSRTNPSFSLRDE